MAGAIGDRHVDEGIVKAAHLAPHLRRKRYFWEKLSGQPTPLTASAGGVSALPTAAQGQIDYFLTPAGVYVELFQTTAQTLMPVAHATDGLEIALDQVDNESVEYVPGGNRVTSPYAHVVGTDVAVFFRAVFKFTNAQGMDQFGIGWRKVQTYGVPTSILSGGDPTYTDYFVIGFAQAVATPANVFTSQDLNDSGSAVTGDTGFNIADGEVHQLEVRVVKGKAVALINGVVLGDVVSKDGLGAAITAQRTSAPTSFTFDAGDTLVPWIFCRQDAGVSTQFLREWECGPMSALTRHNEGV